MPVGWMYRANPKSAILSVASGVGAVSSRFCGFRSRWIRFCARIARGKERNRESYKLVRCPYRRSFCFSGEHIATAFVWSGVHIATAVFSEGRGNEALRRIVQSDASSRGSLHGRFMGSLWGSKWGVYCRVLIVELEI